MIKTATLKKFRLGNLLNKKISKNIIEGLVIGLAIFSIFMLGFLIGGYYEENSSRELISPLPICPAPTPCPEESPKALRGQASFYNRTICPLHNKTYGVDCRFADGSLFDDTLIAAACPDWIPLGSMLTVNYEGKFIQVPCKGRGAFEARYGRLLDFTEKAFATLEATSAGTITVTIEEIK